MCTCCIRCLQRCGLVNKYMKIVVINNIYAPYDRGGAEQVVKKTIQDLLKQDHNVVLITGTPDKEEVITDNNLIIYRIRPNNIYFYTSGHKHSAIIRLTWHVVNMFNFSASNKIKKILTQQNPDIVHTHNLMGLSFLIPNIIRSKQIFHVHTNHDVQLVEPSGMIIKQKENSWRYNGIFTKFYTNLTKKLFGSPDVVISPSQFLNNFYDSRGFFKDSKKVVVRNPIPFTKTQDDCIATMLSKDERSVNTKLLYVGQIENHKGIETLVCAFMNVKNINLQLDILGSGSELEKLKKLAHNDNRIMFHGRASRQKVADFFKKSDVTVVPSLCYENSPTVIFESFFFGVPVLASKMEGIAELIEEGKNGITFEAGNIQELAQKISELDKQKLQIMSKNAEQVITDMHRNPYIDQLLAIYKR